MLQCTDQIGRRLLLAAPARRVVSLVPSQTELLAHLGLEDRVVGITKFCVHPEQWFRSKVRIGGTKDVHLEKVASLQPDLIVANKEENVLDQVAALRNTAPVYTSDVNTLDDAQDMITDLGLLTGTVPQALLVSQRIRDGFSGLMPSFAPLRTVYLIWQEPYMTVGGDTFISQMMARAGFGNLYGEKKRYPVLRLDELVAAAPELLLLSSEPYPFREKHRDWLQAHLPQTRILLVDGEMFSWYGSRMLEAPSYFRALWKTLVE